MTSASVRSKNNGTLVHMCVRGAKVHYFIAGARRRGEKWTKDLYVSCRFPRDVVSSTFLAYPWATSCDSDKVLCRLSECGRIQRLNNRSKTIDRCGCRRECDREACGKRYKGKRNELNNGGYIITLLLLSRISNKLSSIREMVY